MVKRVCLSYWFPAVVLVALCSVAGAQVIVPDVTGLDYYSAESTLLMANLTIGTVNYVCDNVVPADAVISQNPLASENVVEGTPVDLMVSTGPCGGCDPDLDAPVITLLGGDPLTIECTDAYVEPGAEAFDLCDGDLTGAVIIAGDIVNTMVLGVYTVTYNVSDSASNAAMEVTRTVNVFDTTVPVLTLNGDAEVFLVLYEAYVEAGAQALDSCYGDLTGVIIISGTVDVNTPGFYEVYYYVEDAAGNSATPVIRTVYVEGEPVEGEGEPVEGEGEPVEGEGEPDPCNPDFVPPTLSLVGDMELTIECGDDYSDAGATAWDACDGDLTGDIIIVDPVLAGALGMYVVAYDVYDGAMNRAAPAERYVTVQDTTPPAITLVGDSIVFVEQDGAYTDTGATASDACDGDLTGNVITVNPVNTAVPGSYTVRYNVSDNSSNAATEVVRTVYVEALPEGEYDPCNPDFDAPTLSLVGDMELTIECGDDYSDAGATAWDACDGDLTGDIMIVDPVLAGALGMYEVAYDVYDSAMNRAEPLMRLVTVQDTTPPVITLVGDSFVYVEQGGVYTDAGATALDACEGDLTGGIVVSGDTVNVNLPGMYVITYNIEDGVGNAAVQVARTVYVEAVPEGEGEDYGEPVIESLSWTPVFTDDKVSHVEINFTLAHPWGWSCWIALWGHDELTRRHFPMQHFAEGAVEYMQFLPGNHTLTWIAESNAPGESSDHFQVFMRASDQGRVAAGGYLVIDLSGGPEASTYPVGFAGNVAAADRVYKTDRLLLRETPDGGYAGVYQITQQQYEQVTGVNPSHWSGNPMRPVEMVSWNDITDGGMYESGFIAALRAKTGIGGFDLFTALNWEYVCRAGALYDYNDYTLNNGMGAEWGGAYDYDAALDYLGWYEHNSAMTTHDVGGKQPNAWGIHDAHGNVWEWTVTGSLESSFMVRGGTWNYGPGGCLAGGLLNYSPDHSDNSVGFRIALPAVENKGTAALFGASGSDKADHPAFVQFNTEAAALGVIAGVEVDPCATDAEPPIITLLGNASVAVTCGDAYADAGATATDVCDGNLTADIVVTNPVNTNISGAYTIRYNVSDSRANAAVEVVRTVMVTDTVPPTIRLNGASTLVVNCGAAYTDAGATAEDACDGDITAGIVLTNPVNTSAPGAYTVRYNVSDRAGNAAVEATRSVTVRDNCEANVVVPEVVGMGQAEAQSALTAAGLTLGRVSQESDSVVPDGQIMRQSPTAGTLVRPGAPVALTASSGTRPARPEHFTASGGSDRILLRWDANIDPNLTGYRIYRRADTESTFTSLADVPLSATRYEDRDVVPGVYYHYELRAVAGAEESDSAGPVSARAGVVTLFFDDHDIPPGACGIIGLNVSDVTGFETTGFTIAFRFDPAVIDTERIDVQRSVITRGMPFSYEVESSGVMRITSEMETPKALFGEGRLFHLTLCARDDAPEGACSSLVITEASFAFAGERVPDVVFNDDGLVCLSGACGGPGDLDNNGSVAEGDASIVLDIAVRLLEAEECHWKSGELNGDMRIDCADAVIVLRMVKGSSVAPQTGDRTLYDLWRIGGMPVTLSVPNETVAEARDVIDVPVTMTNAVGFAALDLTITFPPESSGLVYEGYTRGAPVSDFVVREQRGGQFVRLVMASNKGIFAQKEGGEDVLFLRFRVAETAAPGAQFPVNLAGVKLAGEFGEDFEWYTDVTVNGGTIRVAPVVVEGEPEGEGENGTGEECCGCRACMGCCDEKITGKTVERMLGDWLLIGAALLTLVSLSRSRRI